MKSAYRIRGQNPRVLKVVRKPLANVAQSGSTPLPERTRRELEAMRTINHPGIVPIQAGPDIREIGGSQRVWYIEPMYSGGTLTNRLTCPWQEHAAIGLLSNLVSAAAHLATRNIVHRDIKPANIAFDESDNPVLLDLGIALFQDLTTVTQVWGQSPKTFAYAAPEQFEARKNVLIDFRTDLFLIGIVLFEVLTGMHPFDPSDQSGYLSRLMNRQWNARALERVSPSSATKRVLRRLLAPDMSRRYRKFEHLYDDIRDCI